MIVEHSMLHGDENCQFTFFWFQLSLVWLFVMLTIMVHQDVSYDGRSVLHCSQRTDSGKVVMGDIRYFPGGSCGPRIQRDVQVVVLLAGSCRVTVDGLERRLPVGHASLHLPGGQEFFTFSTTSETHHSWCACRPEMVPTALYQRLEQSSPVVKCSPVFLRLAAVAQQVRPPLTEDRCSMLDQLGLALLWEYADMARPIDDPPCDAPVDAAIHHMESRYGSADCLADAHLVAGVSRNALIYQFRRRFGLTPARFLWRLRTERGVAMLEETGLSVGEIAQRCGFANPFHFSRLVRNLQGLSPIQLRRQAWQTK